MQIKTLAVGHYETNCYIVSDENTKECAVIDPGDESNTILDYIEDLGLTCRAVMLTHGHFDHTGAAETVCEDTGAPLWMHKADCSAERRDMLYNAPEGTRFYAEGDTVTVGGLTFKVLETPGHTKGSVTLICGDVMFSGDTLFRGSCGRTDLPGGNTEEIMKSLRRLAFLEGDYEVYPGHMQATTLDRERKFNYYLVGAARSL